MYKIDDWLWSNINEESKIEMDQVSEKIKVGW